MKNRFLLFGFDDYQALGGWNDHIGSYDTLKEAIKEAKEYGKSFDNYHIVDIKRNQVVLYSI